MLDSVDLFNVFGSGNSIDNADLLPPILRQAYKNPYRTLGLDEANTTTSLVRDTFRKLCLSFIPHFCGLGNPKITFRQLIFAYNLIRGTLPHSAKEISETLTTNPFLEFEAEDVLPLLRPIQSKLSTLLGAREYRGFRMFGVAYKSNHLSLTAMLLPKVVFTFDVHYCLRRYTVEVDYDDIYALHKEFSEELLVVPEWPIASPFLNGSSVGTSLAAFFMRVHKLLANRGLFSPRLLKFLCVDFEQVQSEEEGILISLLDSKQLPPKTVWHLIDETWLEKWRKFVLGRGPRRYFPPGRITNDRLISEYNLNGHKGSLEIATDYRAVNFNVWQLYSLVHGGGPNISRIEESIYSKMACSYLQACVIIQSRVRVFLAQRRRLRRYLLYLSTRPHARAVLYEIMGEKILADTKQKLQSGKSLRKHEKLKKAAILTQSIWRRKKNYVSEENLIRARRDQEVFARSHSVMQSEANVESNGLVVTDVLPIIRIGNTCLYSQELLEENNAVLPFKTKKQPGLEYALICEAKDPKEFVESSKIISINSQPTNAMTYQEVRKKLAQATWPLRVELERPLKASQVPTLDTIVLLEDEDLQYNAFKIMLYWVGMKVQKHNSSNSKSHYSIMKFTTNDFMYMSEWSPTKSKDDLWNKLALFDIKHIAPGHQSDIVRSKAKDKLLSLGKSSSTKVDADYCFEIAFETRSYVFEILTDEKIEKSERDMDQELKKLKSLSANASESLPTAPNPSDPLFSNALFRTTHGARALTQPSKVKEYIQELVNSDEFPLLPRESSEDRFTGPAYTSPPHSPHSLLDDAGDARSVGSAVSRKTMNVFHYEYKPAACIERLRRAQCFQKNLKLVGSTDELYHTLKCATIVYMFKKLVDEIRLAQIHVDENGVATRRNFARTALRKIE